MQPIVVLEHLPHEHPGVLAEVLDGRAVPWRTARLHAGDPVPAGPAGLGGVVVLGGDMNTDQTAQFPHLEDERRLLTVCVAAGTPVLGLCLGAQLLAEAVGGTVVHTTPEIGYIPLRLTPAGGDDALLSVLADGTPTFNAHGDTIAAAPGAVVLAGSAQTARQALRVGERAWAMQFHPEMDAGMVAEYIRATGVPAYLRANGWEPEDLLAEAHRHEAAHRAMGAALLGRWVDLAVVDGAG